MASTHNVTTKRIMYWKIFRLIFVIFHLYLMRDAFFRWDGFRYYASFSEFLPSIALVTILWSIVAAFTAILVWLLLRALEWLCLRKGWNIRIKQLWAFLWVFLLLGALVWAGKRLILPDIQTALQIKLIVFLCVVIAGIFLTWKFLDKFERWTGIIQERITPLVWLFGIWLVLSVPLVAYHTWIKPADNAVSQKVLQTSTDDKSRPNIILVTFDALTARDMSVYGYHRPTTPFIREWAKTASLFMRLQAGSNFTTPTTASLMTGKRVWTHQTYHLSGSKPVKSDIENLPLLLKNNGYYTMAFVANPAASINVLGVANSFDIAPLVTEFSNPMSLFGHRFGYRFGYRFGFINVLLYRLFGEKIRLYEWIIKIIQKTIILNRVMNSEGFFQDFSETASPPEKVFNRFLSIVDNNPPEPFFAWIHIFPPHAPYLPPEHYMGMFDSSLNLRTFRSQMNELAKFKQDKYVYGYNKDFPQEVQPTVEILRARYDEFIRYCDKQFEDFIAQLASRNKLKKTVIILSSDHGESFEHNYLRHTGPHLFEQLTHIPFIIKGPDQTEGRVINDLTEQIDIPATVLDLANIPVPSWMEGRSLVPLMQGKRLPLRPVFSMNFEKNPSRGHEITRGTVAVWEDDYKLIHYLEDNKSLLFNLTHDPDELNDLFEKEPEVGERFFALIQNNLKKANERIGKEE